MVWLRRVPERFLSRPARGFLVGIALLGVVAGMARVVPTEPLGVDQRWSEAMLDIRTSFLTDLALVFNWLGRGLGWALSLAAVGIVLVARRRWLALLAFGVTEAVTTLSSTLLKILVGRPRPPDGLVHPVGSSFPSGHAAKQAEDRAAAARSKAEAELQADVDEAQASAQAQAAKLRETADAHRSKLSAWWHDMQRTWEEHVGKIRDDIESRRAEHDGERAKRHADRAEDDAAFAVAFAYAAIEEAEYTVLDAQLARMKADQLTTA